MELVTIIKLPIRIGLCCVVNFVSSCFVLNLLNDLLNFYKYLLVQVSARASICSCNVFFECLLASSFSSMDVKIFELGRIRKFSLSRDSVFYRSVVSMVNRCHMKQQIPDSYLRIYDVHYVRS